MVLLKGSTIAGKITEEIKNKVSVCARAPRLVLVRVGENPGDLSYERGAKKRMEKAGIDCSTLVFPADTDPDRFLACFDEINRDPYIDGILVFRPLPPSLAGLDIEGRIDPEKDVDCISPVNMEKVFEGRETVYPCTAQAVMEMIHGAGLALPGKRVAVIGRSLVIGRPVAMMCLRENATVTICHSKTADLPAVTKEADLVIACVGRSRMITDEYLKEGAAVFDVGINVLPDGTLTGDIDSESAGRKASVLTPVPGGVGAVTTAVLAKHVLENYLRKQKA